MQHQVGMQEPVASLAFSPDSRDLVVGTSYGSVRVLQVEKGIELRVIEGHKGSVNAVAYAPDGHTIVSAGTDKVIRFWDAAQGANPQFSPYLWSAIPWGQPPGFVPIIQSIEYVRLSKELRKCLGIRGKFKVRCSPRAAKP